MTLFTVTTANDESDGGNGGTGLSLREAIALANTTPGSTLNDNTASQNGGGLFNQGILTISNSTFSGNTATNSGGGIYTKNSTTTLSNSTVTLNGAASGDGLFNDLGLTIVTSPNVNFSGTDSFIYSISDGKGGTDTATVNVTIDPLPMDVIKDFNLAEDKIWVWVNNLDPVGATTPGSVSYKQRSQPWDEPGCQ